MPQVGQALSEYETLKFDNFFVQPMDGPELARNTQRAIEFCKCHPKWRLSLQIHKILQIP
jgi:organic radical activating enzyme